MKQRKYAVVKQNKRLGCGKIYLHKGTVVEILKDLGDEYKVFTVNGRTEFIVKSQLDFDEKAEYCFLNSYKNISYAVD